VQRNSGKLAVIAFDPQSPITSGALLGDRLRVDYNSIDEKIFYRSLAITGEDYETLPTLIGLLGAAGYDTVFVETVGAGQNDVDIRNHVDHTIVVVVPGMGAKVQLMPAVAASAAAMRAAPLTSSGFQVAAWPSGIGKTVLKP